MDYRTKYIKYKNKYNSLKELHGGNDIKIRKGISSKFIEILNICRYKFTKIEEIIKELCICVYTRVNKNYYIYMYYSEYEKDLFLYFYISNTTNIEGFYRVRIKIDKQNKKDILNNKILTKIIKELLIKIKIDPKTYQLENNDGRALIDISLCQNYIKIPDVNMTIFSKLSNKIIIISVIIYPILNYLNATDNVNSFPFENDIFMYNYIELVQSINRNEHTNFVIIQNNNYKDIQVENITSTVQNEMYYTLYYLLNFSNIEHQHIYDDMIKCIDYKSFDENKYKDKYNINSKKEIQQLLNDIVLKDINSFSLDTFINTLNELRNKYKKELYQLNLIVNNKEPPQNTYKIASIKDNSYIIHFNQLLLLYFHIGQIEYNELFNKYKQ